MEVAKRTVYNALEPEKLIAAREAYCITLAHIPGSL